MFHAPPSPFSDDAPPSLPGDSPDSDDIMDDLAFGAGPPGGGLGPFHHPPHIFPGPPLLGPMGMGPPTMLHDNADGVGMLHGMALNLGAGLEGLGLFGG
eukprot:1074697-Pelagomonas_calceolata.AAC.1